MTRKTIDPAQSSPTPESGEGRRVEKDITRIHACKRKEDACKLAEEFAIRIYQLQKQLDRAKPCLEGLKEELKNLTAPEYYSVVVTGVSLNGDRAVQVAGLGSFASRAELRVHKSVPADQLRVGYRGLVTKHGNCLLKITGPNADWSEVGVFEDYLEPPRRVLLKHQEQPIAVTLSDQLLDQVNGTPLSKGDLIGFDRDLGGLAYSRLKPPQQEHLFAEEVADDDFSQLGGLNRQISQLKRAIDFRFRHEAIADRYRLASKKAFLLHGPPGNGKTRLARCVASYIRRLMPDKKCRFMSVQGSQDYSVWLGQSERHIRDRFAAVRAAAKDGLVVIFFDEIDAIGQRRGSEFGSRAPDRVLNTLLSEIDGLKGLSNVVLIAATNRADVLDSALLRDGRFGDRIEIPAPNRRAAEAILLRHLDGLPRADDKPAVDFVQPILSPVYSPNGRHQELARVKLSDGRQLPVGGNELISGAMLENTVRIAAEEAAWREIKSGAAGISEEDLSSALARQLCTTASLLTATNAKSYVSSIPEDSQPIAVTGTPSNMSGSFVRRS